MIFPSSWSDRNHRSSWTSAVEWSGICCLQRGNRNSSLRDPVTLIVNLPAPEQNHSESSEYRPRCLWTISSITVIPMNHALEAHTTGPVESAGALQDEIAKPIVVSGLIRAALSILLEVNTSHTARFT